MTEPVRVVLVGMPTMMCHILGEVLAKVPGLAPVAELPRQRLDSPEVLGLDPDVLIADVAAGSDSEIASLLRGRCRMRVLTLDSDGVGTLHEMRPHHEPLGELSPSSVAAVARGAR